MAAIATKAKSPTANPGGDVPNAPSSGSGPETSTEFQVGLSDGSTGVGGVFATQAAFVAVSMQLSCRCPVLAVGYTRFPETIYASRPQVAVATADADPGSFFPGPLVSTRGGLGEPRFYDPPNP